MKFFKTLFKKAEANTSYARIAFLFRILLAITYFTVFLSLIPQVHDLIGSTGVLPIADAVASNPQLTYSKFPTLHLFFNNDAALTILLLIGAFFSLALLAGFYPRTSLIACIIIFLSYVTSGRDFFTFQWDNMLLEASFLALFLPLAGKIKQPRMLQAPSLFVVFLFRWLLFRLYFESGLAKILYGKADWFSLNAMKYYYETAPLPSVGGWVVQQLLPATAHQITAVLVIVMELIIPFFIFWPRRLRIIAFYAFAAINVVIGVTSNYGYFNFLSIAIGIFLLDDQHLLRFASLKRWLAHINVKKASRTFVVSSFILMLFVVPFSVMEFIPFAKRDISLPEPAAKIMSAYAPFRAVNRYHLFPGVVNERIVIEILGSKDGQDWKPYRLKHTPQDPEKMPPWLPMYQSRYPFSYSFLTLGRINSAYFTNLLTKLCTSPGDIKGLLDENPFPEPPSYLKLDLYKYMFSTPEQLREQGLWWDRQYAGSSEIIQCANA